MEINLASFGYAAVYLGIPFVIMTYIFQWKWAKTCDSHIQVLVAQKGGGGKYELAPRDGGEVTIHNPSTSQTTTWPINSLATIDIPYPGVGFVPKWMQKTIRLAIVNEGDMEPMLNRSPHRKQVASPDVVALLQSIADDSPKLKDNIELFISGISTGPTREMIADPATLGNLMRNAVLKALANVGDDLLEQLKMVNTKLTRLAGTNPTIVYIGLGLIFILSCFTIYQLMQVVPMLEQASQLSEDILKIQGALGIQ